MASFLVQNGSDGGRNENREGESEKESESGQTSSEVERVKLSADVSQSLNENGDQDDNNSVRK